MSEPGDLVDELTNFREIVAHLMPSAGEVPQIEGIDIAAVSMPLRGAIGGDHLIYIDFNRRYNLPQRIERARRKKRDRVARNLEKLKRRAGILVADVSGHRVTDALIAAMLHQAFLVGAYYELDRRGEITTRIFEHLNTRFYKTTAVNKYFTMIYGEITSGGRFRFISAGHQPPLVFSREFGRFASIHPERLTSFPPVGMFPPSNDPDDSGRSVLKPKKDYSVNEIDLLSPGDILLLTTDGLTEHDEGRMPAAIETILAESDEASSREICERARAAVLDRGAPEDDITLAVIRRTR